MPKPNKIIKNCPNKQVVHLSEAQISGFYCTGNDEEDDDLDHEIASIERVVTDSSEWEYQRQMQIEDTITQVINEGLEIHLEEEIFTL